MKRRSAPRARRRQRRWPKILGGLAAALALAPIVPVAVYRFAPVPVTPLMVIRAAEGYGLEKDWISLDAMSPDLVRAVIAAEDTRFCHHRGFDWNAIEDAAERNRKGRRLRGASTITMQTAKNVLLWPGRSWLRKGIEAYLTVWIETLWPKARIVEVYLNVAEWGPGVYGAEAAARHWFGLPAHRLGSRQAALLAAALPSPLASNPARPSDYLADRAGTIRARMSGVALGAHAVCPP